MIKLFTGLAAAVVVAGCAYGGADAQQGGGERVGTSAAALAGDAPEQSTDEASAADETAAGADEEQGGGERVGGGGTGVDGTLDAGVDEPQGGGERVGGGGTVAGADMIEDDIEVAAGGGERVGD